MAKSDFFVSLDTIKTLNNEEFARKFLSDWLNHPLEQLRPERWGRGEPVRHSIASIEFEQLVLEWCKVALMFTRVSRPRMSVSLNWRVRPGLDPRPYPWDLVAWLAKNGGTSAARAFLELVVAHFDPAFASLTTYEESRRKHFIKEPHFVAGRHVGTAEKFKGHHVLETFPGIYWITYFGRPAIERVGELALKSIPEGRLEQFANGYLLTAYDDASLIGSHEAIAIEQKIVNHLGRDNFFSKEASAAMESVRPEIIH
jgi:hypothetical protein